jgi:hypothetical protein
MIVKNLVFRNKQTGELIYQYSDPELIRYGWAVRVWSRTRPISTNTAPTTYVMLRALEKNYKVIGRY